MVETVVKTAPDRGISVETTRPGVIGAARDGPPVACRGRARRGSFRAAAGDARLLPLTVPAPHLGDARDPPRAALVCVRRRNDATPAAQQTVRTHTRALVAAGWPAEVTAPLRALRSARKRHRSRAARSRHKRSDRPRARCGSTRAGCRGSGQPADNPRIAIAGRRRSPPVRAADRRTRPEIAQGSPSSGPTRKAGVADRKILRREDRGGEFSDWGATTSRSGPLSAIRRARWMPARGTASRFAASARASPCRSPMQPTPNRSALRRSSPVRRRAGGSKQGPRRC